MQSVETVESIHVVIVGSFLGGLVAGIICSLLVVGIVFGIAKLRKEKKGATSTKDRKKE